MVPNNSIVITFDDGYKDLYTFAYPILNRLNIPATIFLVTDFVESQRHLWQQLANVIIDLISLSTFISVLLKVVRVNDEKSKEISQCKTRTELINVLVFRFSRCERDKILHEILDSISIDSVIIDRMPRSLYWKDIRIMRKNGISFGSHTCSHPRLSLLGEKEIMEEVNLSKEAIQQNLEEKCQYFSFPWGDKSSFNQRTIETLKRSNYASACANFEGVVNSETDLFMLPRITVKHSKIYAFAVRLLIHSY